MRTGAPPAPELLDDVGDHPRVGGGRGGEHRAAGRQVGEQVADPPVVGPEVVAPVADAVRLVDDEQPGRLGQPGQLLVAEPRVVEPLGAHQQQVDLVGGQRGGHLGPLVGVGGVHRHRAQPGPPGGVDLVAHQRQQRRHDQRRAAAAGPDQGGGHEVDRRLAPAGALDDEHPLAAVDQRRDRLELPVAELRGRVADQPAQQGLRLRGEGGRGSGGGRGHRATPPQAPDTGRPGGTVTQGPGPGTDSKSSTLAIATLSVPGHSQVWRRSRPGDRVFVYNALVLT